MEICYVLDASAFINGFKINSDNNFTVPEITAEIKDFKSKLVFDMALEERKLTIIDVPSKYISRLHICCMKMVKMSWLSATIIQFRIP